MKCAVEIAASGTDWLVGLQRRLPFATPDLAGTGGRTQTCPEDFEVEEIPAYEPSGAGDHLYAWIEKRGVDARSLLCHLARTLEIPEGDIGYAGLKDTLAVTRQLVSVPARCEAALGRVDRDGIRVLSARRHGHKLRAGHLTGNRFRIVMRETLPGALERAQAIAARLADEGMPNFYGPQRFGRDGATLRQGLATLRGEARPRRGMLLRLSLSAVQSALFNAYLADRLERGALGRVDRGDVLLVADCGGPFVVADPDLERERLARREVVLSGPMFGPKMRMPSGEPAARERALLMRAGLSLAQIQAFGKLLPGTRRPLLVWPEALHVAATEVGLELRFVLPAGSYATVLLRELVKEGPALDLGREEDREQVEGEGSSPS